MWLTGETVIIMIDFDWQWCIPLHGSWFIVLFLQLWGELQGFAFTE